MKVTETGFKDLYLLEPRVFEDSRGFFMESFNAKVLEDLGWILTSFRTTSHIPNMEC
jgi:dTDP-4-dehydrorhamnose 3,5-epimerase